MLNITVRHQQGYSSKGSLGALCPQVHPARRHALK